MTETRYGSRWRGLFFRQPLLTYTETVFWIAQRDADRMAEALVGSFDWDNQSANMVDAVASLNDDYGAEWAAAQPQAHLMEALRLGDVVASGCRMVPMTHGLLAYESDRQKIPVEAWQGLAIYDAPARCDHLPSAIRTTGPRVHGSAIEDGWTDLRFESDGVWRAFPGKGATAIALPGQAANDAAPSSVRPDPVWWRKVGEGQQQWVNREDVLAEADRRLEEPGTTLRARTGALAAMAKEMGATSWTQGALRNAINRTRAH